MSTLTFRVTLSAGYGQQVSINIIGTNLNIDYGDGTTTTQEPNTERIEERHGFSNNNGSTEKSWTVTVTGNITGLGNEFLYYGGRSITEITLPEGLQTIEDYCLNAISCEEVIIPSTVTSIGTRFLYQSNVKKVVFLTKNLTTIGQGFLQANGSVEFVKLPEGLTSLSGYYHFYNCTSLSTLEVPSTLTSFPVISFQNVQLETLKMSGGPIGYPPINENTLIYIPRNALSAYRNHNDYPNDVNRYVLYETTIAGKIYALGTLLAENLTEKNVPSEANEGLTTLANKIPDVPSIAYRDLTCILNFGDNNDEAQERPAQVPILLFANGKIVDSCLLPRDNDTSIDIGYTSDEFTTYAYQTTVPIYDENDNEIFYFWHPFVENLNNYVVHQPSDDYIYLCWIEPAAQ